jgi:hypothetical protein
MAYNRGHDNIAGAPSPAEVEIEAVVLDVLVS